MVSFIIPYCTVDKSKHLNLSKWRDTDDDKIQAATISVIENIKKQHSFKLEIIVVDNSNTFPNLYLKDVKVIRGWQSYKIPELKAVKGIEKYGLDNYKNQTMWASMAYNIGLLHAKYEYVVLQHNDIFYHDSYIPQMIEELNQDNLEYICVDGKKVSLATYLTNREVFDKYITKPKFRPFAGGYVKTRDIYLADCYFFLARKSFFDDYIVDWKYGDTNHGATIKCLEQNLKFKHLGPFHDNPNFKKKDVLQTYLYNGNKFVTHLKGGFSELKMTDAVYNHVYEEFIELFDNE